MSLAGDLYDLLLMANISFLRSTPGFMETGGSLLMALPNSISQTHPV